MSATSAMSAYPCGLDHVLNVRAQEEPVKSRGTGPRSSIGRRRSTSRLLQPEYARGRSPADGMGDRLRIRYLRDRYVGRRLATAQPAEPAAMGRPAGGGAVHPARG